MAKTLASEGAGYPDFVRRSVMGTTSVRVVDQISSIGRVGSTGLQFGGSVLRAQQPLGPGSAWVGSWQRSSAWQAKTFSVYTLGGTPGGNGGSLSLIAGLTGTGQANMTGTMYGPVLIKRGSFTQVTNTDPLAYMRVHFRQGGYRRGSLGIAFSRQA